MRNLRNLFSKENIKNSIKQTRIQAILFNVLIFPLIYFLPPEYLGLSIASLGYPSGLFLNTFIHAGILHIAMNMLVTYQFGELIDELYQKKEQYLLYFALGIPITAIMYLYIYTLQPEILLVGYSGIAMGLVGACFRFFPKPAKKSIALQLIIFHVIIIAFELSVSWEAHLTGFVFGMLYSYNRFLYKQPQNLPDDYDGEDNRSIANF